MEKRIGWSATTVSISTGIVLAIYEVMGWKMSVLVANTLIGITSLAGFIAVIVLCHAIWVWVRPILRRYGLRFPIYRKDKPNPLQWLIDIAEKQRDNPTSHLVITDRIIMGVHLGDKRPRLRVRVCFANFGLNDLTISHPEGYPYFGKEKSNDQIRDEGVKYNVPAGHTSTSFDLDIYIPAEFLDDVRNEVNSPSGEVRVIRLVYLDAKVQVKSDDSPIVKWSIGGNREVFRPNR